MVPKFIVHPQGLTEPAMEPTAVSCKTFTLAPVSSQQLSACGRREELGSLLRRPTDSAVAPALASMVSLESNSNFWHYVFFALGSIALPFHPLVCPDTYSKKLDLVTPRSLISVGCKCKTSPTSSHDLHGFMETAHTHEDLKCRRCYRGE